MVSWRLCWAWGVDGGVSCRGLGPAASRRFCTGWTSRPARPFPCGPGLRPCAGLKRGRTPGPSPVDRGKPGSKMHVLSDANGLPLLVGLSAANTHDSLALKPMVPGHQTRHDPHRGRYFKPAAPSRRQGLRHPSPAEMAVGQAHRRPHRPQGHRVQRTAWPPQMGHRTHHVLADRLPPTQPPLRAQTTATTWPFSDSQPPSAATSDSSDLTT